MNQQDRIAITIAMAQSLKKHLEAIVENNELGSLSAIGIGATADDLDILIEEVESYQHMYNRYISSGQAEADRNEGELLRQAEFRND